MTTVLHANTSLISCTVMLYYVDIMQYSKIIILILFPEVINITTVNTYSRYRFTYHSHVTRDSNILTGDYLTHTINAYNKL